MAIKSLTLKSLLGRLWKQTKFHRKRQLAMLLLLMVIAAFAEMLSVGLFFPFITALVTPERIFDYKPIRPLVSTLGIYNPEHLVGWLTAVFAFVLVASGCMRLFLLSAQLRLANSLGADYSHDIYKKTLFQPYSIHLKRNSSEIIAAISFKTTIVVSNTLVPLLSIASSALICGCVCAVVILIAPKVASIMIMTLIGVYSLIVITTGRILQKNSERVSKETARSIKYLQEGLGGIKDILLGGYQNEYSDIFRKSDISLRKSYALTKIISGSPRFIVETFISLSALLLVFFMTKSKETVESIPLLVILAVGAQRALPLLQQIYQNFQTIRGDKSSLVDVVDLLEQPYQERISSQEIKINFQNSIVLEKVNFRYLEGGPWNLKDVSLEIPFGSRVGIMGVTGSGKTTLMDTIMGFLMPESGALFIDGQKITHENYRLWQSCIAHVPQTIFLTDASVAENIALGTPREHIDFDLIETVARQAQIAGDIESWPDKYHTIVGERGVRLSGGQKQRIGIARAFYKRCRVIVFDEATSALDTCTESEVIEAINHAPMETTVIMVAHRLLTLRNCDFIVELKNGQISRIGSFKELCV